MPKQYRSEKFIMTTTSSIRTGNALIPTTMLDTVVRLYQDAVERSPHDISVSREQLLEDIDRVNARRRSQHGFIRRAMTPRGRELVMFYQTYYPYQIYTNKLAEVALREIQERMQTTWDIEILDLGCGTGVIGLDIAQATGLRVYAADIDHLGVACTKTNAFIRGAAHLINAWQSDGFANVPGRYDVIIFNAPVPHGHDNGLTATEDYKGKSLTRILRQLPSRLREGGQLLLMSYVDILQYMPPNLRSTIALQFDSSSTAYAIHRITVR
jgi:methylase of polypeptide subunit release factors